MSETPPGLDAAGEALWALLGAELSLTGPQRVLALEACRTADRLERLDRLTQGDPSEWAELVDRTGLGRHAVLVIDSALSEARQQQMALKQLLAALGVKPAPAVKQGGGSTLDQLAARRAGKPDTSRPARTARRQ